MIFRLGQDAHPAAVRAVARVQPRGHVFLPQHGQEQRARAVHDGDVGQAPVAVVALQVGQHELEEGVVRRGAHGVVGDSGGVGAVQPAGVGEEGVEAAVAALGVGD